MKNFKLFDDFIKFQLLISSLIAFSWSILIPLTNKLEGLLWTTSLISMFMIIERFSSIISPYLKINSVKKSYGCILLIAIIYTIFTPLYFFDKFLFLIVHGILIFIFSIYAQIYQINYDAFLMGKYGVDIFKLYQYTSKKITAAFCILSFALVSALDTFYHNPDIIMVICMGLIFISTGFEMYNYFFVWAKVEDTTK